MRPGQPTVGFLRKLVGNPNVYAEQQEDGQWFPVRRPLTPGILRRHLDGKVTVGTYIVNPPNQARTLVFDFDEPDHDEQQRQLTAVSFILAGLDVNAGTEFSGKKGHHLWVTVDDYVDAELLYRIGRGIRQEAGLPKLEVYPKQTQVRDLGNLVKLPGGVHRVTGNHNDFLSAQSFPEPISAERVAELAALYPEVHIRSTETPASIEHPCVHQIQVGFEEGGRNTHLFHLAVMLRKFSLTDENVALLVYRANEKCVPEPLPEAEIESILESSRFSGPICDQLDDDVHCGGACVKAKHPGLYTRPGAVKWAADGEEVVLRVRDRTDDGRTIELEHEDIVQGRAILHDARPPRERRGRKS